MLLFFAGPAFIEAELSGGTNFLVFSLIQAGTFAAGVFVILSGVRLVLAEIVPAFKGISTKLVPNAKPALDVPIIFTYAPNAVLIGFFSSFLGGIASMVAMIFFRRSNYSSGRSSPLFLPEQQLGCLVMLPAGLKDQLPVPL